MKPLQTNKGSNLGIKAAAAGLACLLGYYVFFHKSADAWDGADLSTEEVANNYVMYDKSFDEFILKVKTALDAHPLPARVLNQVFSDEKKIPHPACEGSWLEFGVHTGGTIKWAANWRSSHCGAEAPPVYGFDTFTGLPESWYGTEMVAGKFDLQGKFPDVPKNVGLVKGLFNESLPVFLKEQDAASPDGKMADATYIHVDCDLYAGAKDVLTLLNDRMAPGCVLMFDELVNYPAYRDHEIKAMWEWLGESKRRLKVIGIWGPLPDQTFSVDPAPQADLGGPRQSAAFVVL